MRTENILSNETHADVIFIVPKWKKDTPTKLMKLNVQTAFDVLLENIQKGVSVTGETAKILLKLASKSAFYEVEYGDNDDFIFNIRQLIEDID